MKKHSVRFLLPALLLAFLALPVALGPARAQTMTITFPTGENALSFGIVASDVDLSGTLVLAPAAQTVTPTGGARSFGGTIAAPRIRVARDGTGANSPLTYTITWPASFTVTNGAQTATVSSLTCIIVASTADSPFNCMRGGTVSLRRNQSVDFRIGGTLVLPANQARGAYTGTLTVEAN